MDNKMIKIIVFASLNVVTKTTPMTSVKSGVGITTQISRVPLFPMYSDGNMDYGKVETWMDRKTIKLLPSNFED